MKNPSCLVWMNRYMSSTSIMQWHFTYHLLHLFGHGMKHQINGLLSSQTGNKQNIIHRLQRYKMCVLFVFVFNTKPRACLTNPFKCRWIWIVRHKQTIYILYVAIQRFKVKWIFQISNGCIPDIYKFYNFGSQVWPRNSCLFRFSESVTD